MKRTSQSEKTHYFRQFLYIFRDYIDWVLETTRHDKLPISYNLFKSYLFNHSKFTFNELQYLYDYFLSIFSNMTIDNIKNCISSEKYLSCNSCSEVYTLKQSYKTSGKRISYKKRIEQITLFNFL